MASQVLSGNDNAFYTNNTGQNVRVVINFMRSKRRVYGSTPAFTGRRGDAFEEILSINWAGVGITYSTRDQFSSIGGGTRVAAATPLTIGRNLAFVQSIIGSGSDSAVNSLRTSVATLSSNNAMASSDARASGYNAAETELEIAFPTEIILAPNQTFEAICSIHNIVVIPENG